MTGSWADTAAVVLIIFGFSVSAYNLPTTYNSNQNNLITGHFPLTQAKYLKQVVFPVLAGAVLLSAAIASWADQMDGSPAEWVRWVLLGGMVYVLARLVAARACFLQVPRCPA